MGEEIFKWLKSMPIAPTYHPTINEFQDPVSYIYKIEKEASKYGICKIIPPVPSSSKKATITNLNRTLSSINRGSSPTFTTRLQQVGFSPLEDQHPVQRPVWQSGLKYTLPKFESKANKMEKKLLMKRSEGLSSLEIETMYWKAQADRPISVEYANDMPGSAFEETGAGGGWLKQGKKEVSDVMTVAETQWNTRRVARAHGSLLKFVEEDIPGVTSPMIYMGMLYSWFAWHVEDHDLHSLNYMHMGAGKTWYGVPMDAAFALEDVVRTQAYAGEISPTVAFARIARKTTILSPEVLLKAGVPCCRLVQNVGEFVVTFPRAYHSGFSHGFNCAEAVNIATPGWLRVAREAAIRRVSIDIAPMVSDSQLLYDLAMSMSSSKQKGKRPESHSSQLRERFSSEGDATVKRTFVQDVMHSNELLVALQKGSPITLLSEEALESFAVPNKKAIPSSIFSCVTCGSPCYSCVAIVQPSKTAARYLMSNQNEDVNIIDQGHSSGKFLKSNSSTREQKAIPARKLLACGDSSNSDKDSSRLHVFCLDHAREVEQRFRSFGGVHMLLLCHQDYREINDAARVMGKELGISDDRWTDVVFKGITEQDKMMIQWALDDEETATRNQDWAVKLGIDIFHSAKLGCSPSHKSQMSYNAVIYNAYRQKKINVAGRWCGKVWMSNQVHPLIVVRDDDDDDDDGDDDDDDDDDDDEEEEEEEDGHDDDNDDNQQVDHQTVHVFPKMNVNEGKHLVVRTSTRKRNRTFKAMFMEVEASPPPMSPADSEDDSDFHPSESLKRRIRSKPARKLEVRTKLKPKMNQNQAKKGKKVCVCAEDECAGQTFRSISDFNDHKRKTGHFKLFIKELTKKRGVLSSGLC